MSKYERLPSSQPRAVRNNTLLAGVIIVGQKDGGQEEPEQEIELEETEEQPSGSGENYFTPSKVFNVDEETELVCNMRYAQHRVSLDAAKKLKTLAIVLAQFTMLAVGALGVVHLIYGAKSKGYNAIFFAMTAFLNTLSSAIVVWRYFGANTSLYSSRKESKACYILASFLYLLAVTVIVRALLSLIQGDDPIQTSLIVYLSLGGALLCLILALSKLVVAWHLESVSIASDGVYSLVGFLLGIGGVIASVIYTTDYSIWFIEGCIGVVIAVFIVAYATWVIVSRSMKSSGDNEQHTYIQ